MRRSKLNQWTKGGLNEAKIKEYVYERDARGRFVRRTPKAQMPVKQEAPEDFSTRMFTAKVAPKYTPHSLWQDYPNCCGAAIIYRFTNDKGQYLTTEQYDKDLKAHLSRSISARRGLLLAIVNHAQIENARPAFEKHGYINVMTTSNPNHADNTTLYLFAKPIGSKNNVVKEHHEVNEAPGFF